MLVHDYTCGDGCCLSMVCPLLISIVNVKRVETLLVLRSGACGKSLGFTESFTWTSVIKY